MIFQFEDPRTTTALRSPEIYVALARL